MFPSLREIPGAEDDNRPEALLAAACAAPAKVIVGNTVSVVQTVKACIMNIGQTGLAECMTEWYKGD